MSLTQMTIIIENWKHGYARPNTVPSAPLPATSFRSMPANSAKYTAQAKSTMYQNRPISTPVKRSIRVSTAWAARYAYMTPAAQPTSSFSRLRLSSYAQRMPAAAKKMTRVTGERKTQASVMLMSTTAEITRVFKNLSLFLIVCGSP